MPSGVAAAVIMNTHSTPKENTAEYVVHNDKERDEFENSHSEKQRRVAIYERVLADVNRVVDKQAATRSNYLSLCIWLLYFILYAAVLVMQRDPVAAFEVEQTLKDVILTPNSGIVDSATGETVPRFASAADVYQFFQSTMNTLYQDPKCGNGVCENGESKAFADQGCSVDCGAWTQVSTYNISLWSNNPEDDLRYWGLCEKNTHYCLKASQVIRPGDNQTHTVQLFDGEWTLRVEPSMDGIGGKIAKVVVDVAATNAFNATVWQANANKNLIKYRTNPKYFYKSEIVTSWASCNEDTTGVPTGVTSCNSNDEAEYCDDNYLGDGVCDSDCNVLVCAFDKGDCCRPVPGRTATETFSVWNYQQPNTEVTVFGVMEGRVNEVYVGRAGTNRVVGGILVTQTRRKRDACTQQAHVTGTAGLLFGTSPHERFKDLSNECPSATEMLQEPFGYDAQFLPASKLYSTAVVAEKNLIFQKSSKLDPSNGLPFGFHYYEFSSTAGGYPIFFDININQAKAMRYVTFMEDGGFIDEATEEVKMYLMTYNAPTGMFGALIVTFEFTSTGFVNVGVNVQSASVQPYRYDRDLLRLGLELLFVLGVVANVIVEVKEVFGGFSWEDPLGFLDYFQEIWNYLDVLNIGLLSSSIFNWFVYVTAIAPHFQPPMRYEIYDPYRLSSNSSIEANMFEANPTRMKSLISSYDELEKITRWQSLYIGINGVSFIIMIFRTLKMMNFQPRVGLVTRTLEAAAGDLVHFIIVFAIITAGYAVVGHLNFGHSIEAFSTIWMSLNSCAEILLGEIGLNAALLEQDFIIPPLLFFWSYIFIAFFILINILLAIIVDSYAMVKESADDTTPLPTEVRDLLLGRLGGWLACDSKRTALEKKLKKKLKWQLLVDQAEEEGKQPEDEEQYRYVRKRFLKVSGIPVHEELGEESETFDEELFSDALADVLYTGILEESKESLTKEKETSDAIASILGNFSAKKNDKHLRRRSSALKRVATSIKKMAKGIAVSDSQARRDSKREALSILKYFGDRKKVRVKKAKAQKNVKVTKVDEVTPVVAIDIPPASGEDAVVKGNDFSFGDEVDKGHDGGNHGGTAGEAGKAPSNSKNQSPSTSKKK